MLPGFCVIDVLLELGRFERLTERSWHRVLQPDAFIREEKEEAILDNGTAYAAGVVAIFLVDAVGTVAGDDGELAGRAGFASDF